MSLKTMFAATALLALFAGSASAQDDPPKKESKVSKTKVSAMTAKQDSTKMPTASSVKGKSDESPKEESRKIRSPQEPSKSRKTVTNRSAGAAGKVPSGKLGDGSVHSSEASKTRTPSKTQAKSKAKTDTTKKKP